jgi:hypothetical protein
MLKAIGNTILAGLRNWTMLIALVVTGGLAIHYAAQGKWIGFAALAAVVSGIGANLFVMVVNGGRMPVRSADAIGLEAAHEHQMMNSQTRLAFLGDWIRVRDWLLSPGDICLYAGLAVFLVNRVFG